MIRIEIPKTTFLIGETDKVHTVEQTVISMEHSLRSLKEWESRWKIPFLWKNEKTAIQMLDYLRCMTLTEEVDPYAYQVIPKKEMERISRYIRDPMSATKIKDNGLIGAQKNSNEMVTAETIYYWMITLNIPVEFQDWHLEQLLTLIKLTSIKNDPKKRKMTEREVIAKYAEMNERNRKRFGISG